VKLQFGASLTDDARSVNYDRNTFIIQATGPRINDFPSHKKIEIFFFEKEMFIHVCQEPEATPEA
jgi:hypothetical protein